MVKSATRTLRVLEFFAERQSPASVGEIAQALRLPQSSASILLRSMHKSGYLSYDARSRSFMPTMRVAQLGNWLTGEMFGELNPIEIIQRIHHRTGELVFLGLQNDLMIQYVHAVQSTHAVRFDAKPGWLRPILHCAVGRALVAVRPDREVQGIIRRCNAETDNPDFRVKPNSMMDILREARRRGYVQTENLLTKGASVIAVPLPHSAGQPHAAIGVGGPVDRIRATRKEILSAVAAAFEPLDAFALLKRQAGAELTR
jgi:IclR family KDG regulon transcriptional repressor